MGTNIDAKGNQRQVFFVLHDISDRELAEEIGILWAGALENTPIEATSEASFDKNGWTFYGDLPNPVGFPSLTGQAQSADNDYSPLRRVNIAGKDVVVNAFFVKWGDESWEQLRVDQNVVGFPDDPPNTSAPYNGLHWGVNTGHAVEINTTAEEPYVRLKLHKSWAENGDYIPYYIVVDSFPAGPPNNMGVIYVPKHRFLQHVAVPLIQFVPPVPLSTPYSPVFDPANPLAGHPLGKGAGVPDGFEFAAYPPTSGLSPAYPDEYVVHPALRGGGPLGGQIGLPTYFMPEDDYSPMWHIGFAHWIDPSALKVVKGLEELKFLREEGKLMIHEWPGIRIFANDYDFDNLNSPHVVNCPAPVTVDSVVHRANKALKAAAAKGE